MGVLDKPMKSVAHTLGNVLGSKATSGAAYLVRVADVYDPIAGAGVGDQGEVLTACVALPPRSYRIDQIDGTEIKQGDMMIDLPSKELKNTLGALIVPTAQSDLLKFNGERLKIVTVTPVYAGAEVCLFTLQCRR